MQAHPTVAVSRTTETLHRTALAATAGIFDAARAAGHTGLFLTSGFRDFARQSVLYINSRGNGYVLPPGFSEHNVGLAADFMVTGHALNRFGTTPQGRWVIANAHNFGMILRYPAWATQITGVNYESWHFRYVGTPHARFIHDNSMVLEQYIDMLRRDGHILMYTDGVVYYVIYQEPVNGMISVPQDRDFSVSSSNVGGYIITVRG